MSTGVMSTVKIGAIYLVFKMKKLEALWCWRVLHAGKTTHNQANVTATQAFVYAPKFITMIHITPQQVPCSPSVNAQS